MAMRVWLVRSAAILLLSVSGGGANAQDWPQWRGIYRDGHAGQNALLDDWEQRGPLPLWIYRGAGPGYSSLSIVGNRLFSQGNEGDRSIVFCIDTSTGKELWKSELGTAGKDGDYLGGWGVGPRGTPTITLGRVFALSDLGELACFDANTGEQLWKKNLISEFAGTLPKWGYSESPLVDGRRVYVTPGGENFIVGLNVDTGETEWKSQGIDDEAHYSSIIKHTYGGVPMLITASKRGLVGLHGETGAVLFRGEHTANDIAVIPTPIAWDEYVYHSSNYGAGNTLLKLSVDGGELTATEVYALKAKSMQNHHGGVVLVDGVIYGFSKGTGGWMAQDAITGETLWTERAEGASSGSICYADGRLYCFSDGDGTCYLVEPSREAWTVRGKLALPEQSMLDRGQGKIWAHPVVAGGMLFLRDLDLVFAFDIRK
jgi:outer membrane protein assembly factor BamB